MNHKRATEEDIRLASIVSGYMLKKLERNQHKTHWLNLSRKTLASGVGEELQEFFEALFIAEHWPSPQATENLLCELGDITNRLAFLADKAIRCPEKQGGDESAEETGTVPYWETKTGF